PTSRRWGWWSGFARSARRSSGHRIPWRSSSRVVVSACRNGRFRWLGGNTARVAAASMIKLQRSPAFAHVGKIARQNAEASNTAGPERAPTYACGRSEGTRSPSGQLARMGRDSRTGSGPRGLALSGLWRAASPGRASRGEALARRVGLRPGPLGGALPVVSRTDRRALRKGAARGNRSGRRAVPLRRRQNWRPGKAQPVTEPGFRPSGQNDPRWPDRLRACGLLLDPKAVLALEAPDLGAFDGQIL